MAPLFLHKARLFRSSTFVIGHDTYVRLVDPKYYASLEETLSEFADLGTRFVVAGRGGQFLSGEEGLF